MDLLQNDKNRRKRDYFDRVWWGNGRTIEERKNVKHTKKGIINRTLVWTEKYEE